jgi:aryl-alcohol dehydrogenase-like predicted oxidoreductase
MMACSFLFKMPLSGKIQLMEKRVLGKTGMEVSVLGFGGAEIGFESASESNVGRLLGAALDAGLNLIDTAECYWAGTEETASERLIGEAVAHRRGDYYLFSKVGHASGLSHASGLPHADWTPALITASIDRSLVRLKTDAIDLMQFHSCSVEVLKQGDAIAALQAARDAGKIKFLGYSGENESAQYAIASGVFDVLQTSVNIADQRCLTDWLPQAREKEMGIIAKRPIANACWKHTTEDACPPYPRPYWNRLQVLAYDFLTTPDAIQTALRFTLTVPGVATAIVGTKNPERWVANAALLDSGTTLSPEAFEAIRNRWEACVLPDWTGQV